MLRMGSFSWDLNKKDSMTFFQGKILVIASHPDDETLGMGGTIAKAVALGSEVWVVFLGEGISARFPPEQYSSQEFKMRTELRTNGAIQALKKLGIKKYFFGSRLCTQFDQYSRLSIVKDVENIIEEFDPDLLFTHDPVEVNIDHKITYEVVEVACRPTRGRVPREIYTFEIVCSGSWTFDSAFKPNVYVDVSEYFEAKMEAWHCYVGEDKCFPFPRSRTGLETLARYRGMASGLSLAEGFKLVRKII